MAKKPQTFEDYQELAARALCRRDGNPENVMFESKPMWMAYLGEVDAVFEAIGFAELLSASTK